MTLSGDDARDVQFCRFRFTGKERDTESGNDYMFARYYNSATGRFLSPDWSAKEDPVPYADLHDPQSLNLYSYVRNHPLNMADPDGHCCEWLKQKAAQGEKWAGDHPRTVMALKATGAALATAGAVAFVVATAPVSVPATLGAAAISALTTTTVVIGGTGAAVATVAYTAGAVTGDKDLGKAGDAVSTIANPAGLAVAIGSGGNMDKADKAAAAFDVVTGGKDLLAHPSSLEGAAGAAAATAGAASLAPEQKDKDK